MSQSLCKNIIHCVFATKERRPFLRHGVREKLHAYIIGILARLECPSICVGGVADHVHAMFCLSKNVALKDVIQEVKRSSSKWVKGETDRLSDFAWQGGYAAFSVCESAVSATRSYIKNQEEHHRTRDYRDELIALLSEQHVAFDEKYFFEG